MESPEKQRESKEEKLARIQPFQWKKGQSGNIMGRPKGKTMKEYVNEYLARMTDDERDEWLEGINKDKIWEMAEGKPRQDTDITSGGKVLQVVVPQAVAEAFNINESTPETGTGHQG